jgi:hypothetical protein
MLEYKITKPEEGFIRVYTYEVYDLETDQFNVSSFNWTTPDALLALLTTYTSYTPYKIVSKDISIDSLKKNSHMPFISGYVYDAIKE